MDQQLGSYEGLFQVILFVVNRSENGDCGMRRKVVHRAKIKGAEA